MEYLAVYRREDDPQYDGLPVALFRDGAIMGNWHRTAAGIVGKDAVMRTVELDERMVGSLEVRELLGHPVVAYASGEDVAFEQLKAEAKARLTREAMEKEAEDAARRELANEARYIFADDEDYSPVGVPLDIHEESGGIVPPVDRPALTPPEATSEPTSASGDSATSDATIAAPTPPEAPTAPQND